MIGTQTLEIGPKEFLEGMTSSPETSDGGFSPETTAINLQSSQDKIGVIYATPNASHIDATNGRTVATCIDPDSGVGIVRYLVTSTGRFYSINADYTLSLRRTSAGVKTYQSVTTDTIIYKNALYATSTTDITVATGANLGSSFDESWWTTTKGKSALTSDVPHPELVFEDSLWIADGNKLHKWDGTTATEGFLTLNTGLVIQALGIDPSTGLMLIAATEGRNASDTLPRTSKLYLWDGFSNKPRRAVVVDDMVTAMYPHEGTLYMFYGQNIGYWTGSGIRFLRALKNGGFNYELLIYKHHVTNDGKALLVLDGKQVLVIEDLAPGQKRYYYGNSFSGNVASYLDCIFSLGSHIAAVGLELSNGVYDIYRFSRDTRTTGTLTFYSKKYSFKRPIQVREIYIEYADSIASGATPAVVTLINENKVSVSLPALTNDSASAVYSILRKYNGSGEFRSLQLKYDNSATSSIIAGVRRYLISYDYVE